MSGEKKNELSLEEVFGGYPVPFTPRRPVPKKHERPSNLYQNTQASRVIERFGGAARLSRILATIGRPKNPSSIYRWMHPTDRKGTGGIIPATAWPDILQAARADGIVFTPEELDPRPHTPSAVERKRAFNLSPKGRIKNDEFK